MTFGNRAIRLFAGGLLLLPLIAGLHRHLAKAQDSAKEGSGIVEVTTRFSGMLSLPKPGGETTPIQVELKEWHLAGQNRSISIPQKGFYVAELRFGAIQTEIKGKIETHAPGDHWIVENDALMVIRIRPPGEEAILQTVTANPAR